VLAGRGGGQDHGFFIEVRGDGTLCLLREATGLETDRPRAELTVIENGFGEFDFWTLHRGVSPLFYVVSPYGRRLVKEQEISRKGRTGHISRSMGSRYRFGGVSRVFTREHSSGQQ